MVRKCHFKIIPTIYYIAVQKIHSKIKMEESNQNQAYNINDPNDQTNKLAEIQNKIEQQNNLKKIKIMTYHKYFTDSFIEIINIVLKKSNEFDISVSNTMDEKLYLKLSNSHKKLRMVCDDLINGFTNDDQYDQAKIIKKIYKTITQHVDKIYPVPSKELFTLKNNEGATITIIPGLNMGLVTNIMTDEELENLWDYMYVMYVSSVSIISLINEHKKSKVADILQKMKERVIKSGVLNRGTCFANPFLGVNSIGDFDNSLEKYDIEAMFSNIDQLEESGDIMENLIKVSGVDKMINMEQIHEQLKNIKEEDMQETKNIITKLLGAENDEDMNYVCSTLVEDIVEDLKLNSNKGTQGLFETLGSLPQKIGKKIDGKKMGKTMEKFSDLMANGQENLKNLKDEKGNPIGEQLMNSLKGPLQMAQKINNNKNNSNGGLPFDLNQMASLLSQFSTNQNNQLNQPNKTNKTK